MPFRPHPCCRTITARIVFTPSGTQMRKSADLYFSPSLGGTDTSKLAAPNRDRECEQDAHGGESHERHGGPSGWAVYALS